MPPFPFDAVRRTVEAGLGRPLAALFAEFDPEPVAAASVAQVHRAVLHSADGLPGERVAVKVRVKLGVRVLEGETLGVSVGVAVMV